MIRILPPQLANQIAAGEVVERPASIVKELMENSLDAKATKIDVFIEDGGRKLIRIHDNGTGISKEDLPLALERHATSKITSLEDLDAIMSLGFRGEALASISSVSRLTIMSKTDEQEEAWQAYTEGRTMSVQLKPVAHPVGTTLEILDLFYNTPARRKFLRSDKTEFTHIDEVVRRLALSHYHVAINLTHNGKLVRQYRAVPIKEQHEKRIMAVCGTPFLTHALKVDCQYSGLSLYGWITTPHEQLTKTAIDYQYCYVNERVVRDKLINHAIKQAYQDILTNQQSPAYVLFFNISPSLVDVNVHPAKSEVRFHQSRLVHDFIYQAMMNTRQQAIDLLNKVQVEETAAGAEPCCEPPPSPANYLVKNRISAGENVFHIKNTEKQIKYSNNTVKKDKKPNDTREHILYQKLTKEDEVKLIANEANDELLYLKPTEGENPEVGFAPLTSYGLGRVLTIIKGQFALLQQNESILLLSLVRADHLLKKIMLKQYNKEESSQPLLLPLQLALSSKDSELMKKYIYLFDNLGFYFVLSKNSVQIRSVPPLFRKQNIQKLITKLLNYLANNENITNDMIVDWLADFLCNKNFFWNQSNAIQLLTELERLCPEIVEKPSAKMLQFVNLDELVNALA